MSLCLSLTAAELSVTRDVVAIIGTVGALVIGILGLSTWHRQLHGTSKFQVAKNILISTYRIQDAIQAVRSPMLHLNREEVEAGRRLEEEQRIYSERLQRVSEQRAELRTLALEAKAIWGEKGQECFQPLHEIIGTMHAEIGLHFWLKGAYAGPGATVDRNPERVAANDKIVYYINDNDEFSQKNCPSCAWCRSCLSEKASGMTKHNQAIQPTLVPRAADGRRYTSELPKSSCQRIDRRFPNETVRLPTIRQRI